MERQLEQVEKELAELRIKWSKGSPAMKRYLEKIEVPPLVKTRDHIKKRLAEKSAKSEQNHA